MSLLIEEAYKARIKCRTVDCQSINMKRWEKLGSAIKFFKSHWETGNNDYFILFDNDVYKLALHQIWTIWGLCTFQEIKDGFRETWELGEGAGGQIRLSILWVGALKSKKLSQIQCYLLGKSKPRCRKYLNSSKVWFILTRTFPGRRGRLSQLCWYLVRFCICMHLYPPLFPLKWKLSKYHRNVRSHKVPLHPGLGRRENITLYLFFFFFF